jgi:ribose/xylose/arabinose/galactoside ABC-type transport system permease subunit
VERSVPVGGNHIQSDGSSLHLRGHDMNPTDPIRGPTAGPAAQIPIAGHVSPAIRRRPRHPLAHFLLHHHTELGSAGAVILVFLVFAALNPYFLTVQNIGGIMTVSAETGLLSLGAGILIIAAEIDISISAVFTMSGIIAGTLIGTGWPGLAALAVSLAFGAAAGALNAVGTLLVKLPSLIVTLGTLALWSGIAIAISGGSSIYLQHVDPMLDAVAGWTIGTSTLHVSVVWWLLACLCGYLLLHRSAWGNWIYATGGNAVAARSVGVPSFQVKFGCFVATGVLAAMAGVVSLGRNALMSPVVTTNNLEAIAAAVIGGVSIWGGIGSVAGIMLGTVALSSIDIGLVTAGAPAFWYQALVGMVIVVIVSLNRYIETAIIARIRS